jgi:hypothetical protein
MTNDQSGAKTKKPETCDTLRNMGEGGLFANDQSVDEKGAAEGSEEELDEGPWWMSAEAGSLYEGLYDNSEETKFCPQKDGSGTINEWDGSHCLYSRRRT